MPELPEVETVIREIKPFLIGKKFWKLEVFNKNTFLPSIKDFEIYLPGKKILDVYRRGKYIIFELSEDFVMVVHLRMTGALLISQIQRNKKHFCAEFIFSDAKKLYFRDIRKFGRIYLYKKDQFLKETGINKLGIDPIVDDFTLKNFVDNFSMKRGVLKKNLLDQSIIAGIGNIYADEIAFKSKLHPLSEVGKLNNKDLKNIFSSVKEVLELAIENNGSSIENFVDAKGQSGHNQNYLQVYGRKGEKCLRCDFILEKIKVMGRGTYFCPNCQELK